MLNRATQAAAFILRKKSRSRRFIATLTAWSPGLTVAAGDMVQSFNLAWRALNGGITGAVPPNNDGGNAASDRVVTWTHVPVLTTQQPTI